MTTELWHAEWASFKAEIEARFSAFKLEIASVVDKHHSENRIRLQAIDAQGVATGVKVDKLYGSDGQPGVVDRLSEEVKGLGNKIVYASGFLAAVVLLVGWYIARGN
jgi:hypothetical protein